MNLHKFQWTSAVGHESTAEIMSELLGYQILMNRIKVEPKPGDRLLCFKLKGRAPEGKILNKEEIKQIGYEWMLLVYHGSIGTALDATFQAQSEMIRHYAAF